MINVDKKTLFLGVATQPDLVF